MSSEILQRIQAAEFELNRALDEAEKQGILTRVDVDVIRTIGLPEKHVVLVSAWKVLLGGKE